MRVLNKFDNVTHDIYCDLFDKMIMPILCYGSEVWGLHKGEAIERVHLQFCKRFLHLKYNTVNNIVYYELGRTNIQCVRYVRIVKYWLKIMKCNDTQFTKIVYNVLLCDAQKGKVNWVSRLKNVLETLGFGHVWFYQSVENDKLFFRIFNQRIRDNYGQRLHFELENMSRGKYFILYHKHFVASKYLEKVKTESHRIAPGRQRSSNHRLAIESGRWHKPHPTPVDERRCMLCDDIEDEYNFICICRLYKQLRKRYIPEYYFKRPNMNTFIELMSNDDTRTVCNLANFVFKAF